MSRSTIGPGKDNKSASSPLHPSCSQMASIFEISLDLHRALLRVPGYNRVRVLKSPEDCMQPIDHREYSDELAIHAAFPENWSELSEDDLMIVAQRALSGIQSDHFKAITPEMLVTGVMRHLADERAMSQIRQAQERINRRDQD